MAQGWCSNCHNAGYMKYNKGGATEYEQSVLVAC